MTTIKLKNGSGAPTAGDLVQGEPALDLTNKRLYTEDSVGTVIEVGTNPGTDVTFADNRKAIFGAGSDLQIYHDGTNSQIVDAGSGILSIAGNSAVGIYSQGTGESMIIAKSNAEVELYYDNSQKLETTATGIDVTGSISADGLTVSASPLIEAASAGIKLSETDTTDQNTLAYNNGGIFRISTANDAFSSFDTRLSIDHATGDISFYEDTGTTAKLFWDASAESLGIGTSSPLAPLDVESATGNVGFNYGTSSSPERANLWYDTDGTGWKFNIGKVQSGSFTSQITIQDDGNVGIGTSSPSSYNAGGNRLVVGSGSGFQGMTIASGNAQSGNIYFADGTTGDETYRGHITYDHSDDHMHFKTAGTESMRIDSSGNLLVGGTSTTPWSNGTGTASDNQLVAREDGILGATAYKSTTNVGYVGYFNRTSTDGGILAFNKNGTTVGSIGTYLGSPYIGTGDTGLLFETTNNRIEPFDTSALAAEDAAIDLGQQFNRFKDLYLSGGVYAGNYASFVQGAGGDLFITNTYASGDLAIESGRRILFKDSGNEAGRFDGNGNFLVGGTLIGDSNSFGVASSGNITIARASGTPRSMIDFKNGATSVGSVTTSTTATTYNTSSDQRLKENIVDAPSASDDIDAIQVRSFDWKADGSHQKYGMVAQELQSVAPEAVTGDANSDEMMGVDYSKLVPMLVKEIQSLRARVAQLETN